MAAEKKAFVLRINPETLKELERWAQEEFRSVNGQIEFVLHEALKKRKKNSGGKSTPDAENPAD
ncbi:Arc family DNA-binding protein [Larkinella sp. VNQ87]|uniref:Arc family DNA-binding protein n=1 Tax=Larkinella sp. VNQ87 TaxID=3400921 RepID=UPI003BFF5425